MNNWCYSRTRSQDRGAESVLTASKKAKLVKYVVRMCDFGYGFSPTILKMKVYEITKSRWHRSRHWLNAMIQTPPSRAHCHDISIPRQFTSPCFMTQECSNFLQQFAAALWLAQIPTRTRLELQRVWHPIRYRATSPTLLKYYFQHELNIRTCKSINFP